MKYNVLYNWISPLTGKIGNYTQLPDLQTNYIWVGDSLNRPKPTVFNLLSLAKGNIWIGNKDNLPVANPTIALANLPSLNVVKIGQNATPFPQVYGGTKSGVPVVSDDLAHAMADLAFITARNLQTNFIFGDAKVKTAWGLGNQFLIDLDDRTKPTLKQILMTNKGKLSVAISGVDYVDFYSTVILPDRRTAPVARAIPVWQADNTKLLMNTKVFIDNADNITNANSIGTKQVKIYDQVIGARAFVNSVNLIGPAVLVNSLNLVLPSVAGVALQVLTDIGGNANGSRNLAFRSVLPAALTNNLLVKAVDAANNPIFANATLRQNYIWQGNANNLPVAVLPNFPQSTESFILKTNPNNLPNAQSLSGLLTGIMKWNRVTRAIVIARGGANVATDDYATPAVVNAERIARVEQDGILRGAIAAVQNDLEAQLAALAGYTTFALFVQAIIDIGLIAGGYAYGQYIKGQTLNVNNTWRATDLNDEGHTAVGHTLLRYPKGYDANNRGHGTLWFDSNTANSNNEDPKGKSEGGLRIFSWDSGGDIVGKDSPLKPVHFGIFGYQNRRNNVPFLPDPTPTYKGFIFRSEFDNNPSIKKILKLEDGTEYPYDYPNPDYRYPINFGLYEVKRTISGFLTKRWGWIDKKTIFEYDYKSFNFNVPIKLPTWTTATRPDPSKLPVGTMGFNSSL
jgi:hypothetical protein